MERQSVARHTGMWLWLTIWTLGNAELQMGRWCWDGGQVGPCTWRRAVWRNTQIWRRANLGGNLFNLHIQLHQLPLLFWISQPMHGVSLWRQQNNKKKNHKKKKQQMYNWSFVRLPYCVSFDISWCVCETVHLPFPCILSLSTQSHWSLLHKGGRTFLFKLCWVGSPLGVVWLFFFWSSVVVL